MIRLIALAAVAAALILAVAGCGGSSSKSSAPATSTTTTENTDTSGTGTDTSGSGTDTSGTSTGSSNGAVATKCLDFAGASSKIGAALAASATGGDTGDLKAYFAALADKAPGDVKAAFQTFAEAFGKYSEAIKDSGFKAGEQPTAAQIQKLEQATKSLSTPEVRQASNTINAWVKGGCK